MYYVVTVHVYDRTMDLETKEFTYLHYGYHQHHCIPSIAPYLGKLAWMYPDHTVIS